MIFLDSAKESDARQAKALGWVKGITTNPTLLAQAGLPPEQALAKLAEAHLGTLFYQLVSKEEPAMLHEAQAAREIVGDLLGLKLMPTPAAFSFVTHHGHDYPCAVTAVYSPAQALVASEAGAKFIIAYVNRATRLMGDGIALVASLSEALLGSQTEILVASIKSPEEAVDSVRAGAQHLTLPLDVILAMARHPLSEQAGQQFDENGTGLNIS